MDYDDQQFILWGKQPIKAQNHNRSAALPKAWLSEELLVVVDVSFCNTGRNVLIHTTVWPTSVMTFGVPLTSCLANIVTKRKEKHLCWYSDWRAKSELQSLN